MSKQLITGIIETAVGIGLEFTPLAPLGTSLIGAGLATTISGIKGTPKPDATETATKQPRPVRVSAYGRCRIQPAYMV